MTLSSEFYGLEEWPGRQRRKQLAAEQQLARERRQARAVLYIMYCALYNVDYIL